MTGAMSRGDHLSIGEVLALLRDEFPDVTISKIRFLESQGLIDPERTPSGYRKFYDDDVTRLRWILTQQKEHFLPLKVIKGRLDQIEDGTTPTEAIVPTPEEVADAAPAAASATPEPVADEPTPAPRRRRKAKPKGEQLALDDGSGGPDELAVDVTGVTMSRAELREAAGLTDAQLNDLEGFGMLAPAVRTSDGLVYDEDALQVARLAAGFLGRGVEARHLRMYRNFAEREATLYGQVVLGLLRQRNPDSRAKARDDLVELSTLGRSLRTLYLRRALDEVLRTDGRP